MYFIGLQRRWETVLNQGLYWQMMPDYRINECLEITAWAFWDSSIYEDRRFSE
jgi:hypothetical protein